ncbi:MAG: glycosyltransferase family 2 protein [Caulobacteraceae bacterium]
MTPTGRDPRPEVSAVIPCLNEQENVRAIAGAVAAEFEKMGLSYEILFVDNSSTDGTVEILKEICAADPKVRLIVNNQNYGQMRSPTHGIYEASATGAVIGISADFQDPPGLIGEMIARWRSGSMIVLAVRSSEDTSPFIKIARALGYGFFERFGDYSVIPGATGFGLYDRRVVDALRQWRDPEPFFRGMLVESGYTLSTISYHRPERADGRSKNSFATIVAFFLSGLASSSKKLLRLPIYLSAPVFLLSFLAAIFAIILAIEGYSPWPALAAAALAAMFALIFLFLGLIGEQVRLISEMARNTPLVIERERVNFPPLPGSCPPGPTMAKSDNRDG